MFKFKAVGGCWLVMHAKFGGGATESKLRRSITKNFDRNWGYMGLVDNECFEFLRETLLLFKSLSLHILFLIQHKFPVDPSFKKEIINKVCHFHSVFAWFVGVVVVLLKWWWWWCHFRNIWLLEKGTRLNDIFQQYADLERICWAKKRYGNSKISEFGVTSV